jgi:hypothetical protein
VYGLNAGEYSSPSSSILWPIFLIPFVKLPFYTYVPLILNIVFSLLTVWTIIYIVLLAVENKLRSSQLVLLICVLLLSSNLIGLIYLGMEHSLQVLLSVLCLLGLLLESQNNKIVWWFPLILIAGPLVRYENLSFSMPILVYLFLSGYRKVSLMTMLSLITTLMAFSGFLYAINQPLLPASILRKGNINEFQSIFDFVAHNFLINLKRAGGLHFVFLVFILSLITLFTHISKRYKKMCIIFIIAILLHMCCGRLALYFRYGMYLYVSTILWLTYLFLTMVRKVSAMKFTAALLALIIFSYSHLMVLVKLPEATNNIYLQQYQMRNFAIHILQGPVAVNDIGLVSYNNPFKVQDLFGLGNTTIQTYHNSLNPEKIASLVQKTNIKIVMIYRNWFKVIPPKWSVLGCLKLCQPTISVPVKDVHFYLTDALYKDESIYWITQFKSQLPKGAAFGRCNQNHC